MKNLLIKPSKENLTSFVTLGGFLIFIGFFDVLANNFLNLNRLLTILSTFIHKMWITKRGPHVQSQ